MTKLTDFNMLLCLKSVKSCLKDEFLTEPKEIRRPKAPDSYALRAALFFLKVLMCGSLSLIALSISFFM